MIFDTTDWAVLCEPHGDDIDEMTVCNLPARTVHGFPNNKARITCDLKTLPNKKKRAFRSGDKEELRRVQHDLRKKLHGCKGNYGRKLEDKLQQNNVREVWSGMKQITGCKGRDEPYGRQEWANEMNCFFNRSNL